MSTKNVFRRVGLLASSSSSSPSTILLSTNRIASIAASLHCWNTRAILAPNVLSSVGSGTSNLVLLRTLASTPKTIDHSSVKTIKLRTCVGIYDRLRKEQPKLYRNAPSEGVDITIDYYDNLNPAVTEPEKTILAIHGVPGNYTNFDPIPQYFAKKNVRFIVPNLPTFADTRRTKAFWHSAEEKAQFLKDFLQHLNVKKIDCLISHSIGFQPASQFWDQCGNIEINSFAFFSPHPLWRFEKQNDSSIADLIFLFKSEWWFNLLDRLKLHKRELIPLRYDNINEFLLMASVGLERKSPVALPGRIDKLVNSNKPIILLYGSREKLISKRCIKALHERLGISENEIVHIDKDKDTPEEAIRMDRRIMYYNMKDGGHFVHANLHPFTIKMIENLLNYQHPEQDDF